MYGSNALPLHRPDIITNYVCADIVMGFLPEVRSLVPKNARKHYSRIVWNTIYQEDGVEVFDTCPDQHMGFSFNDEMVYVGNTVSYVALQLAASAGYNPIYTLGVDLGMPMNGIDHIPAQDIMVGLLRDKNLANPTVDKRLPFPTHEAGKKKTLMNFLYAKSILDSCGISVYNLSSGGNLTCFPRMKFEDVVMEGK